jgi:hypothetical protein
MYILADRPTSKTLGDAFDVLDDAFGTGEFSKDQAIASLSNEGFTAATFQQLCDGDFITSVDDDEE